jgi:hypothetical protein
MAGVTMAPFINFQTAIDLRLVSPPGVDSHPGLCFSPPP